MPTVNDKLYDEVVNHDVEVQRFGAWLADKAIRRLNESDAEIFDVIRRAEEGRAGLHARKTDRILHDVENINTRAYREIRSTVSGQLKALAQFEAGFTRDMIENALPFEWRVKAPKAKLINAIYDEEPLQGGTLDEWFEGMAYSRLQRARMAIRTGVSLQEEADHVIKRVRGTRSLNYRDGALALSRRSNYALISTMVTHTANKARATVYRDNLDIISTGIWVATLDDVTCEICASLEGTEMDLDTFSGLPPIHPNCRCSLTPLVSSWDDLDVSPLSEADKIALDGKPPHILKYSEWLAQQSPERQAEILGPERALMFQRGTPIKRFTDHSGIRYTLPELRAREAKKMASKQERRVPKFTTTAKRKNFGWTPDLPDQRDVLFGVEHPQDVAPAVRVTLRDRMPPDIFNQGALGSCTANALIAALMFMKGESCPMLSRLDLYYKERVLEDSVDEDAGAEIRDGMKALAKWGVCQEKLWPYKIRQFRTAPSAEADADEPNYKIKKYMRLRTTQEMMKCLSMGRPFTIGMTIYENFDDPITVNKGIMRMPTVDQRVLGGHAICVIGYDSDFTKSDTFKRSGLQTSQVSPLMFEARNSYGPDWGDGGHFWVPGEYLDNRDLSDDCWAMMS